MAELKTLCFGGDCLDNTLLEAGNYIKIDDDKIHLDEQTFAIQLPNFTLSNNSLTNKEIWTAPENGILIATLGTEFAANSSGSRYVNIIRIFDGGWDGVGSGFRTAPAPSGVTITTSVGIKYLQKGTKIGARFFQNSGSNINISNIWLAGIFLTL